MKVEGGSGCVGSALRRYAAGSPGERADVDRVRALAEAGDPWDRAAPLHVTASALVVHPATRRVLLRWHERQRGWLQVGGHGDEGEDDPFEIARREAEEETGLTDLVAWPDPDAPRLIHVVVVPVPASAAEPAHEHADLRYVLATATPDLATPERPSAPLRWLSLEEAGRVAKDDNVRESLRRLAHLITPAER